MTKSTYELKEEIKLLDVDEETRNIINDYIKYYDSYSGIVKFPNTFYRNSLQSIIDNYDNKEHFITLKRLIDYGSSTNDSKAT